MKQLEIKTNKRLLIVEYDDYIIEKYGLIEYAKKAIESVTLDNELNDLIGEKSEVRYELICKGSDITEDIAKGFIEFKWMPTWGAKDYVNENNHFTSALESFISAIESKGYHWGENPEGEQPIRENYKSEMPVEIWEKDFLIDHEE